MKESYSNAEKIHAIELVLNDSEGAKWSNREIARRCNVGRKMVGKIRKTMLGTVPGVVDERKYFHHQTGKEITMRPGGADTVRKPAGYRIHEITTLVEKGNNTLEIAEKIGLRPSRVRQLAKKHKIALPLPGDVVYATIKPKRVINQTCDTLCGCAMSIDLVKNSLNLIPPEDARILVDDLSGPLRAINLFYRKLRGIANGISKANPEA